MVRRQLWVVSLLILCLALLAISPGIAQPAAAARTGQASALAALILNGDFEGDFYVYGSGQVAEYWVPYSLVSGSPQFLRSTLHPHQGAASQQVWSDNVPWYAGIQQTTVVASASTGAAHIQAGKKYTVHVWVYSIYGGAGSAVQNDKINKRVGIHPSGGVTPLSSEVVWTPWFGQDKVWTQINCAVTATGNRLTVFIEASDPSSGGQDQLYIDDVWLEEEGAGTPTPTATTTPVATATPVATPTPVVGVRQTIPVGAQPQGVAVVPQMDRFFVANNGADTINSLEGFLNWRNTSMPSGGDSPTNVAVDEERCRLYVVNTASSNVAVLNACTSGLLNTISLGAGRVPGALAVLTTTKSIYVANTATNSVSVINADTLTTTATITVGPMPGQIATNARTNKVYVTFRGSLADNRSGVTVIDANAQHVLTTIGLSGSDQIPAPGPYGIAVNPVTNRVYVATESGKMVVIDGASDTIIAALPPPIAGGLGSVAVNPTTNHVFISTASGNTLFVYDADEGRWLSPLTVGTDLLLLRGIAVNPLSYDVLVSNPGDNTVTILRDSGAYQPFRIWMPIARK
jgi:YVTN family beta-propeller protein